MASCGQAGQCGGGGGAGGAGGRRHGGGAAVGSGVCARASAAGLPAQRALHGGAGQPGMSAWPSTTTSSPSGSGRSAPPCSTAARSKGTKRRARVLRVGAPAPRRAADRGRAAPGADRTAARAACPRRRRPRGSPAPRHGPPGACWLATTSAPGCTSTASPRRSASRGADLGEGAPPAPSVPCEQEAVAGWAAAVRPARRSTRGERRGRGAGRQLVDARPRHLAADARPRRRAAAPGCARPRAA